MLLCLLAFLLIGADQPPRSVAADAWGVIDGVNALRGANGLPALKINDALMAAAQSHSEWMAANETTSHSGSGGSSPGSRAAAFGYGGGGVVENIAAGSSLTSQGAVGIWQGDGLHLNTMLNPAAVHIGAGAADGGGVMYYTLLTGSGAGQSGSGGNAPGTPGGAPANSGAEASAQPAAQIIAAATPGPDGSITHVVGPGQSLWNIAAIYKVQLPDLLTLNGLAEGAVIYPEDKVLIKPPDRTQTPTPTETSAATPTRRPSRTPTPLSTTTGTPLPPTPTATATPLPIAAAAFQTLSGDPLLLAILGLFAFGALLVFVGSKTRRGTVTSDPDL